GKQQIVFALRNGKLVPVVTSTGLTKGTNTEVLSGLQPGDQVVVRATGGSFSHLSGNQTSPGGNFTRPGKVASGAGLVPREVGETAARGSYDNLVTRLQAREYLGICALRQSCRSNHRYQLPVS